VGVELRLVFLLLAGFEQVEGGRWMNVVELSWRGKNLNLGVASCFCNKLPVPYHTLVRLYIHVHTAHEKSPRGAECMYSGVKARTAVHAEPPSFVLYFMYYGNPFLV